MTDFDVEYGDVYSSISRTSRKNTLERHILQQNFMCKIVKHTGDCFTISNSPYDSLDNLYSKIERNITTGFSFGIIPEYSTKLKTDSESNVNDKVHDLFVQNKNTKSLKSLPRTDNIRLFDYIQQNPDYFIPDEKLHIFKTYTIYLVDSAAIEYAKNAETEKTYWDLLREIIYHHVSCLTHKPSGNKTNSLGTSRPTLL
jgi:hypothetical protein